VRIPAGPRGFNHRCDILSGCVLAAIFAIRAHKVGVTKLANGFMAVLFTPRPEIAPCEATEDCRTSRVRAFALERIEDFFDGVCHGAVCISIFFF
jgi:hypothetical protein